MFTKRAETIITDNITYDFNDIDITNTRMRYNYDNTNNKDLITDLERLRTLLDPKTLAKTLEGLKSFLALPRSEYTAQSVLYRQ